MKNDYMYEYENGYNNKFSFKNLTLKHILVILGVFIIIIIVVLIVLNNRRNYRNSYEYIELKMVESAKKYINANNLFVNNEIYLDVSKLGFKVKDNCSLISGVLVNKNHEYTAYLSCDDYESNILNIDKNYSLNGKEITLLAKGIPYVEAGVNSSSDFKIEGNVGSEEGVYSLKYNIIDNNQFMETLTRKVIIVDNVYVRTLFPQIVLNGESVEYVKKGEVYTEKGVTVIDGVDGNITNKVKIDGEVNSYQEGEYNLTYSITNSRGYTNTISRKVVVVNNFSTTVITAVISPTTLTNGDVTIGLSVFGDKFDYITLPDGKTVSSKAITYKVSENGIYNFFSRDKDGKSLTKIVYIDNINKSAPSGTCLATLYNNRTEVVVNASSKLSISGYNYTFDGIKTGFVTSSNYTASKKYNAIVVTVKNSLGTTTDITCQVVDKSYREIYVNDYGKNCLEGYTCFRQGDYCSSKIPYCSTSRDNCGPICVKGCSVTSMSTIISRFGLTSSNGEMYNPYTLTQEVYYKVASAYFSGASVTKRVVERLGLQASDNYNGIGANKNKLLEFLRKDIPVIIRVGPGPYTENGHLMAILGINSEGKVFLADTGGARTTSSHNKNYKINTWVDIDEIASGQGSSSWFVAIGPKGSF